MEQTISFSDFPLKETLLTAIEDRGFTTPTEIQAAAVPLLALNDVDFVGQAQTGTGKTAAFSLPLLNKIDVENKNIQAIVLSPTRELANQICEEMRKFSVHARVRITSVYGGTSIDGQIRTIKKQRPQVIIGTPGRVLDLINRKVLDLNNAKIAVLDEADEMLDMGFIDDVKTILSNVTCEQKNTWMFSATMPPAILDLIKNYLNEPEVIKIKKSTLSNENITQKYYVVGYRDMNEAVCRILDSLEDYYGIIFCRTKIDAKNLTDELNMRGFPTDSLHGDMDQRHRDMTMKKFKEKTVKLLVCTDVAARGIDVDHLTHVINYGLPQDLESYVHRIGRTGRAGQKGVAMSIVEPSELYKLRQVERMTKAQIFAEKIPNVELIKDAIVRRSLSKFEEILENLEGNDTVDKSFDVFKDEFDHLDSEQILKVMYTYIFKDSMQKLDEKPNIDARMKERGQRNERSGSMGGDRRGGVEPLRDHVRFFVNIGRNDGVTLKGLLGQISTNMRIEERKIRNVSLKERFSFIEVPTHYQDQFLNSRNMFVNNREVRFEVTKNGEQDFGGGHGGRPRSGGGRGGRSFGNGGGGRRSGGDFHGNGQGRKPRSGFRGGSRD